MARQERGTRLSRCQHGYLRVKKQRGKGKESRRDELDVAKGRSARVSRAESPAGSACAGIKSEP